MACFIVPGAEAVITTAAQKILEHHEKKTGTASELCFSKKLGDA